MSSFIIVKAVHHGAAKNFGNFPIFIKFTPPTPFKTPEILFMRPFHHTLTKRHSPIQTGFRNGWWSVIVLIGFANVMCSALRAQVIRLNEDYPGQSNAMRESIMAKDYIYFTQYLGSSQEKVVYYKIGEKQSQPCEGLMEMTGLFSFLQTQDNDLLLLNEEEQVIQTTAENDAFKIVYTPDTVKRQQYFTSFKNANQDVIFLFGEFTDTENWYTDSLAVYIKPLGADTLTRIGVLQTPVDVMQYPEDYFEFTCNDQYLIVADAYLQSYYQTECFDLHTGHSFFLNSIMEHPHMILDFVAMDSTFYFFDGATLHATNGSDDPITTIDLPYDAISFSSLRDTRLTPVGHHLLFRGRVNDQVALLAFDTATGQTSVLGYVPWNLIDAQVIEWNDQLVVLLRTYDYGYKVWTFDFEGGQTLVADIENINSYQSLALFSNENYVFWNIGGSMQHFYRSSLEPLTTERLETPELDYSELPVYYPFPDGFYCTLRSAEFGREMGYYANPNPLEWFERDAITTAYPNPCSNEVVVHFGSLMNTIDVQMHSLQGQLVYQQSMVQAYSTRINMTPMPSGVYFITLVTPHETRTVKVIKS